MRVCYFGTYRAGYARNEIVQEALRRNGVEIVPCQVSLWTGIEDRVQVASGGWARPAFAQRLVRAYRQLLAAHRQVGDYDVLFLGYPGQVDVFLARLLAWKRRRPLVLDILMSLYLVAEERGLVARHPFTGRLIRTLEWVAYRVPDRLIMDTPQYVTWFGQAYGLPAERFRLVPIGADERIYRPVTPPPRRRDSFRALYYGTFTRNHSVDQIVRAAALLKGEPGLEIELVGTGPERANVEALAGELGVRNIVFRDWVDKEQIPYIAAAADVCLGAFGQTQQSLCTFHNKIYEGLAMRRPVLSGDSPTVRAVLTHGEQIYLVPRGDPAALAKGLLELKRDPALRERLASQGYDLFQSRFTLAHVGAQMAAHLEEVCRR
jgi:glycosyltransferase involved in cell wall biosynthesis